MDEKEKFILMSVISRTIRGALSRGDVFWEAKIRLVNDLIKVAHFPSDNEDWEDYREVTINSIAEGVFKSVFPIPNPYDRLVQELVYIVSSRGFFEYCSEDNKEKIRVLARYCDMVVP